MKALDLAEGQKAILADGRAAAEPVRADLRVKIKALFESPAVVTPTTPDTGESPTDVRKARREKIRELIVAARAQLEPSASKFVAALTVEQRAKLTELAQKHGRTFDESKFTQRIAGMFLDGRGGRRGQRGHRGGR